MIKAEELIDPQVIEMCALYEQTDGLEDFCAVLQIEPLVPESIALFDLVHNTYTNVWTALGEELFQALMMDQRNMRLHPPEL